LPVMDGDGLVGIITSSDVMRALARLVGVHEPGSRLEVALPDRPGSLARIAGITRDAGVNLVSVLVTLRSASGGQHITILRLATIDPGEMVEQLGEAGYSVLWPPETHLGGWRP
ncbi:MAG: ACT domain-containing protein, partial [Actinomycetota bacterium]|nr:ACT domain-containing protein [Actinomycetota bacterium]